MTVTESLISELEDAVTRGSPDRRVKTLRQVTDLFVRGAKCFDEGQVELFDVVIQRLADRIESGTMVQLGRRLAPIANAPRNVMRRLAAHEDIQVAGPVLTHSERLSEADLVAVAESRGQAHLLAISRRREVGEPVTDVLVRRGDTEVVRNVAGNSGARFSASGLDMLVRRASSDEELAQAVIARSDVPLHQFEALVAQATEKVRARLLAAADPAEKGKILRVLGRVSAEVAAETSAAHEYEAALAVVRPLHEAGILGEQDVLEMARAGRFEVAVAALSVLSGMPVVAIDRLMHGERPDPVLVLAKSLGFAYPTARALLRLAASPRVRSGADLDVIRDEFEKLSRGTAERALRFWQVREAALRSNPSAAQAN